MQTVSLARPPAAVAMAAVLTVTVTTATYACPPLGQAKAVSGGRVFQPTSSQVAWAAQHDKLAAWAQLPLDWDGEEGVAPSTQVLLNARAFITAAELAGVTPQDAYVAGDGEVGYVWDTPNGFASMSFLPGGVLVGKVRSPGRRTYRINQPFGAIDLNDLFFRISQIA